MDARKYGRTYHFPFSPGTTSDDRIKYDYWHCVEKMPAIINTEKLDGENNCLNKYGVFARSHAAPTTSPWTVKLREHWQLLKRDLGDLEFFGENLYAIHSIEYKRLEHYYYVFGIRENDNWLSWEEVCFYAALFDLPTVPVLTTWENVGSLQQNDFEKAVLDLSNEESLLESLDAYTGKICTREGIVSRNINGYPVTDLCENVFKYVRKGHVKTDAHWTKNWRRAPLWFEQLNK